MYSKSSADRELVTIMALTSASDNFIQPVATFKGKECHSEFTEDFPYAMFVAKNDCDWLSEKRFHDQVTLFLGMQNFGTLFLAVRRPWLQLKSFRL